MNFHSNLVVSFVIVDRRSSLLSVIVRQPWLTSGSTLKGDKTRQNFSSHFSDLLPVDSIFSRASHFRSESAVVSTWRSFCVWVWLFWRRLVRQLSVGNLSGRVEGSMGILGIQRIFMEILRLVTIARICGLCRSLITSTTALSEHSDRFAHPLCSDA